MESITRKPGKKLISQEFAERKITLAGWIIASDSSDLIAKIDDLHNNLTRKGEGIFAIDADRNIDAMVSIVSIGDPHYSQNIVPMEIEFIASEPFFKGNQQTVTWTITSGTASQEYSLTVSGTVFAEPLIIYNSPGSTGTSTTSGIEIEYEPTGQTVTWSGWGLAYSSFTRFDYQHHKVLEGSTEVEADGVFVRWEPGETDFTVTYSGTAPGGTLDFVYRPRYL